MKYIESKALRNSHKSLIYLSTELQLVDESFLIRKSESTLLKGS